MNDLKRGMRLFCPTAALVLLCAPIQAAVVGFWAQDEISGNLIDSTGGHAPATISPLGVVDYGQPGVPNGSYGSILVTGAAGTSIRYGPNASDDFFLVGSDNNNPAMNIDRTGALTIMAWINPNAPDVAGRTYRPFSTGGGAGTDAGWGFGLRLNDIAGTNCTVRFTGYAVADNDSDPFAITFGQWIHIAATYNNGAIIYFLNGVQLGGSDTSLFNNDGPNARATIGARLGGNDVDQTNGLLDGVRIYNEVLTPTQIQEAAVASVVPEPATCGLMLLGGASLLRRRRR
jgi:hypothetical protein